MRAPHTRANTHTTHCSHGHSDDATSSTRSVYITRSSQLNPNGNLRQSVESTQLCDLDSPNTSHNESPLPHVITTHTLHQHTAMQHNTQIDPTRSLHSHTRLTSRNAIRSRRAFPCKQSSRTQTTHVIVMPVMCEAREKSNSSVDF